MGFFPVCTKSTLFLAWKFKMLFFFSHHECEFANIAWKSHDDHTPTKIVVRIATIHSAGAKKSTTSQIEEIAVEKKPHSLVPFIEAHKSTSSELWYIINTNCAYLQKSIFNRPKMTTNFCLYTWSGKNIFVPKPQEFSEYLYQKSDKKNCMKNALL